jgi:hypothetical protein
MARGCGSSGRVAAYQELGPKFNHQYHKKKERKKERKSKKEA